MKKQLPTTSAQTRSAFISATFYSNEPESFIKRLLQPIVRNLFVLILILGFAESVKADFAVTTNGGSGLSATYPSLAAAISALNAATITGPVIITCPTGSETSPAGGYSITATGTAVNTISINGNGAANSIITAPTPAGTVGALNDAIFKIIGGDFITISGFAMNENPANDGSPAAEFTAATNTMVEWGVALLYATSTNGAQNCTIQNNSITLNRLYQNSFGIYSNSTHTATVVTTSASATTTAGGNSGLKIYGNTITNVNQGICVVGPTAAADMNTGLDIGGLGGVQANSITNWGTTGTFSGYANVSGTLNCILVRNSISFNISFNTLTSSAGGNTATTSQRAIYVPAFSASPTGALTNTINSNNISVQSGFASGTLNGIIVEATTGTATSSITINSNNFNTFGHTVGSPTGAVNFINNTMTNFNTNINFNTFTSISLSTTGSVLFIGHSVTNPAGGTDNISNNAIVTSFTKTGTGGGTITFINNSSGSTNSVTETWNNNNFSNITVPGTTVIAGIVCTDGGTVNHTANNNTISNIVGGTGSITGILSNFGGGLGGNGNEVIGNIITNISSAGPITAINVGSSGTTTTVSGNTIRSLATTGASSVIGITSAAPVSCSIFKNTICDLQANNASGTVSGILVSGGILHTIANNRIGDLRTPIANAANPLIGISVTGGTTTNVYFNTVYLNGMSSGALFGSSAISVSTSPTVTLDNNIFDNTSGVMGAGLAVAYRRSSTTLTTYGSASDRNDFFATTIFTDGTGPNTFSALGTYKTFVGPTRDANSVTENPPFLSTTCGNTNFLKINTAIPTLVESNGANVGGITDDFENDIRFGNPGYAGTGTKPDIGADEFNGTPSAQCMGAPAAGTITGVAAVCSGLGTTLTLTGSSTDLGITYQWKSSTTMGGPYTTLLGTSTSQATGPLTMPTYYVVDVTCTNPGGSTTTTSEKSVLINPLPPVMVSPTSGSICNPGGTPVPLTATGASTYTWSPTAGLTPTTGAAVSANPVSTTTYTVTGIDVNGCANTANATISVTVSPQNVTAVASPSSICTGSSSNLTSTGYVPNPTTLPNGYLFTGSTGTYTPISGTVLGASAIGDDVGIGNLPIGFAFIHNGIAQTVFAMSSNGLILLGNTSPTISGLSSNALASTANVIAALWDDNNTTGSVLEYMTTGPVGSRVLTVQWTNMHVGNGGNSGQPTISVQIKLYETTNIIQIIYGSTSAPFTTTTASIGITGSSGNFLSVTPLSPPNTSTVSSVTENTGISSATFFPSGTTYTFNAPSLPLTYSWSPAGLVVSPGSQNTATNALSMSTTFTVTVNNGGCSSTASVTVDVSTGATITGQPMSTAKCIGETATFTVLASGPGLMYAWEESTDGGMSWNPVVNGGIYSNATTATLTLTGVTSGMNNYRYRAIVSSSCGSPVTTDGLATLTVNPLPAAVIASGAGTFCTSTIITASNGNDGTIYFQGTVSNGTSTSTPSASQVVTNTGTYYFRAQSAAGCWGPEGSVAVVIQTPAGITTGDAMVCVGSSGSLTASASNCTSFANSGTTFGGTFVPGTDPVALRPTTSIVQTPTCSFDLAITRNYQITTFQVNLSGTYTFDMTSTDDGMAYMFTGAFTPGTCGTWIQGDDDTGPGNDPQLIVSLTAGVTYKLVSTTWASASGTSSAAYSWTVTPPVGGQIMLPTPGNIEWYTTPSGGSPIGTGSPFNPVGVMGSGLANTNTPGTTTYYAACSSSSACRTPANFIINPLPSPPTITVTNSTCQSGCMLSGGTFNIITSCGAGSTLTYFSDAMGSNPTPVAPVYNQTTPMTIYYACVDNTTSCRSSIQSLTTMPGTCSSPNATITSNASIYQGSTGNIASVPSGGAGTTYLWSLSSGMITGGAGTNSITYKAGTPPSMNINVTVTSSNGCSSSTSKVVAVLVPGSTTMIWEPDNITPTSCGPSTNCCHDTLCYNLKYTPGVTGFLTTYTTGFFINCLGATSPVGYNKSCVMNDNSFQISQCALIDSVLFNSSGNNGGMTVPVTQGSPIILHRVCLNISTGESVQIREDNVTNLSASVDQVGSGHLTEFPTYTTQTFSKPAPIIPANVTVMINCPADTLFPVPPPVVDFCGNNVPATLTSRVSTPSSLSCEGTKVYNFNYIDCSGYTQPWSFTYIVEYLDFTIATPPGGSIVACPALSNVVPTPPVVIDHCGRTLSPTISDSGMPACEGLRFYVFTYTDCEGNTHNWVYTYFIEYEPIPNPVDITQTVNCPLLANVVPVPPTVVDNCGVTLSPSGPTSTPALTAMTCEGTRSFTWTYVDCEGNTQDFVYTYIVERQPFADPVDGGITVGCPVETNVIPAPPTVLDNCGTTLSPSGPVVSPIPACEGTRTYTWAYTDCEGNTGDYVFTYTVDRPPFTVPADQGSIVNCPEASNVVPLAPVIIDACGVTLIPIDTIKSAPVTCQGVDVTRTYTFHFKDCSGLTLPWVYTYTVRCFPLTLKVFLEGPYDAMGDTMRATLNTNHVLPGQDKLLSPSGTIQALAPYTPFGQPYNMPPWNYNGNTGLQYGDPSSPGAPMGVIPYPRDVVDWVLVTVRKNGILPANDFWSCAGWVHTNGVVTFPDPCPGLVFNPGDSCYVLVQHRTHLGALSTHAATSTCTNYIINWDFTTSNSYAPIFRYGQKLVEPGKWAMHGGNGDQISSIAAIGSSDLTTWRLYQNAYGYNIGDYDMSAWTESAGDEFLWKGNQNRTSGIIFY